MSAADRITELGNILETCAEGKESIAEALTSKGVPTEPDASFDTMAVNVGLIEGGGAKTTVIAADAPTREPATINLGHDPVFPIMVIGRNAEAPDSLEENKCWMSITLFNDSIYAQYQTRSSSSNLYGNTAYKREMYTSRNSVVGQTIHVGHYPYSFSYSGYWVFTIIEGLPINQLIDTY